VQQEGFFTGSGTTYADYKAKADKQEPLPRVDLKDVSIKIDVDANPGLAARFGAQSIPLLVVMRDGREVDRIVGALPRASLEQRLGPVLAS
jgi:thiol-disulfide isomerase/thioredoxin